MVLGVQSGTVMVKSICPKRCRLVTSFSYSFVVRVYMYTSLSQSGTVMVLQKGYIMAPRGDVGFATGFIYGFTVSSTCPKEF